MYRLMSFAASERGAALAEWGLLVVLIAIVTLIGVRLAGTEVSESYSDIASSLSQAGS